jgi:hypothetical protein
MDPEMEAVRQNRLQTASHLGVALLLAEIFQSGAVLRGDIEAIPVKPRRAAENLKGAEIVRHFYDSAKRAADNLHFPWREVEC